MAAKDHCWVSRCGHLGQSHFGKTPCEKESQRKRREEEKKRERGRERGGEGEKDSTRRGRRGTSRTVCPGWPSKGEDPDTKQRETSENYETPHEKTARHQVAERKIKWERSRAASRTVWPG